MKLIIRYLLSVVVLFVLAAPISELQAQCASPHNTIMNYNNGQDGNMFNVTALNDVYLDSVWCNFDAGTVQEIEIWYRTGTVVGFANAATGWTMIDSVLSYPSAGVNQFTKVPIWMNLFVGSGSTVGLYVTRAWLANVGPYMRYTNGPGGSTAGGLYNQNTDIQVSYAYGKDYPFGTSFNPRIWNGRIFYHCCPQPPTPQGPITGDTLNCIGDTVTYWIPWDSLAVNGYEWSVPASDSIISGQGDSIIQIVVGPGSTGGQICVAMVDTCTTGPDTCISYSIDQPASPGAITGPVTVCQNNSAWYSIPALPGIIGYTWSVPSGATILSNADSNAIHVQFASASGDICVQVTDNCATSDSTCLSVTVNLSPTLANAGPDKTVCSGKFATLGASAPGIGSGVWTIVNSPGPGTLSDSSANNATYSSNVPGQHLLQWTTSSDGCPSTSDQMIVEVIITPTANFTTANVCEGAPVGFQDQSTGNGSTITSWLWDMDGDGVDNHIIQNPVHNYNGSGVYNVRLIVNSQGCADTLFKDVFVNPVPEIEVEVDDVCLGFEVDFDNTTTVSSGIIDSLSWDFNDGSAPQESSFPFLQNDPSYLYGSPGSYNVVLTAVSDSGCQNSEVVPVEIYHLPTAKFNTLNSCQFQTTSYKDQSSVQGSTVVEWAWNFGDGSDSSFVADPEHDYKVNGFVPVSLQVWSEQGCYDDTVVNVEIFPTPETQFNYTNRVCLGDTLDLQAVSTIAYGSIVSYEWVVDDSFNYVGPDAMHYFDEIGLYTVELTSESDQGCRSTLEKEVPVYEVPQAHFTYESQCKGDEINFRDSSQIIGSLANFTWDFGDGSALVNEQYTFHAYDTHGVYNVKFIVESHKGCVDSVIYPVEVYERVIPKFEIIPDSGCSPLNVQFNDVTNSVTDRDLQYRWYYGDGFSRMDTAEYTYINTTGKPLYYDVTLEILSDQGCQSLTTMDSGVLVMPQPIAGFNNIPELDRLTTADPLVQFVNTSQQANWYTWTFGDGERSNEHNPSHEYQEDGEFTVQLIARNVYQCRDTISKVALVEHANVPFIPSAFTPNGDGMNDVFMVEGLLNVTDFSMEIFDRWGNLIFSTEGLDSQWDGRNSQRKIVQQGVYAYRIRYTDRRGEEFEHQGNISVIGIEY